MTLKVVKKSGSLGQDKKKQNSKHWKKVGKKFYVNQSTKSRQLAKTISDIASVKKHLNTMKRNRMKHKKISTKKLVNYIYKQQTIFILEDFWKLWKLFR